MDHKTVLLVEDNTEDEFLITRAFKRTKLPIEVSVVRDGQEALDFLFSRGAFRDRRFDVPPNLILLDLDLPKVDGFTVLRSMRAERRMRLVPVVIFTASAEERDRTAAYELGANSYVVKPAEAPLLQNVIQELCRYWLSLNSPTRALTAIAS